MEENNLNISLALYIRLEFSTWYMSCEFVMMVERVADAFLG